jgi:predicted DCC family thiol-disulfide oxidoreductase YuxK
MPHLVLYDGECGLCDRAVQFLLDHDTQDVFVFAALQSAVGQAQLVKHGRDPNALDTMVLVVDHGTPAERALVKGRAASFALQALGGGWAALGAVGAWLPLGVVDTLYDAVAKRRRKLFGPDASCRVMDATTKAKFLDAPR